MACNECIDCVTITRGLDAGAQIKNAAGITRREASRVLREVGGSDPVRERQSLQTINGQCAAAGLSRPANAAVARATPNKRGDDDKCDLLPLLALLGESARARPSRIQLYNGATHMKHAASQPATRLAAPLLPPSGSCLGASFGAARADELTHGPGTSPEPRCALFISRPSQWSTRLGARRNYRVKEKPSPDPTARVARQSF